MPYAGGMMLHRASCVASADICKHAPSTGKVAGGCSSPGDCYGSASQSEISRAAIPC